MNFRRTLSVATAVTAVTLWPGLAAAQDRVELEADRADVDVEIAPGALDEEAAQAEEMGARTEERRTQGAQGAEITVDQPAPRIIVDQPSPDIVVEQPAPEITVEQAEPDVRIYQAQPEVMIEQPAPEVRVQQPEPRVRVRQGQPDVRVRQSGQPEVQIQREEARIETREQAREAEDVGIEREQRLEAEDRGLFEEEPLEAEEDDGFFQQQDDELMELGAPAQEDELGLFEAEPGVDDELIMDAPVTDFGATLMVGGGVTNFTQSDLNETTDVGGFWDVRGAVGTRSIVGLEAAYHGNARDIQAIGLADETFLVGNGLEAALRLNAPLTFEQNDVDVLVEPFAFGGVGWTRYNLFNEGVNTSDVLDQDDILIVPVGVGVGGSVENVYLDARFTYRPAFGSDLVGDATGAFDADSLSSWGLGAHLGFEF